MKIVFFSAKPYDREYFDLYNKPYGFKIEYFETHLGPHIVNAVEDADAVCVFVNDKLDAGTIRILASKKIKIIALRCAGFNNVDLESARELGIKVCRVPAYSPEAVAEHAAAMVLTLNRKTHKAYNRVREQNFSLNGLLGFNLHGKTAGVIGTGKIGAAFCRIMQGFGTRVLATDMVENEELKSGGVVYLTLPEILEQSDIISLHCPLTKETHHMFNQQTLAMMKPGAMLINTSRGGLICTKDVIEGLKKGRPGYLGIDVYEQEEKIFFRDLSGKIIDDDEIQRLMSFPNVLITAHQAFFTKEALIQIAETTLGNISRLAAGTQPDSPGAVLA